MPAAVFNTPVLLKKKTLTLKLVIIRVGINAKLHVLCRCYSVITIMFCDLHTSEWYVVKLLSSSFKLLYFTEISLFCSVCDTRIGAIIECSARFNVK